MVYSPGGRGRGDLLRLCAGYREGRIFGKSSGWARVTYYRAKMKILEYMEAENNE